MAEFTLNLTSSEVEALREALDAYVVKLEKVRPNRVASVRKFVEAQLEDANNVLERVNELAPA